MPPPENEGLQPRQLALFVAPWAPTIERPGPIEALKTLQTEYDVTILCLTWSDSETRQLLTDFPDAQYIPMRRTTGAVRTLFGILVGRSLEQSFVGRRALEKLITKAVRSAARPYSFAFFNVIRSAQAMSAIPKEVPIVFDIDEVRSDYYEQLSRHSPSLLWRVIARIEARNMARAIRAGIAQSAIVLVTSQGDLPRVGARGRAIRHSHVFGPEPTARATNDSPTPRIVFVGRLSYFANIDAIEWFIDGVWPQLHSAYPSLILDVVGAAPSPALRRRLEGVAGLQLHADVPSVVPYLERATLSISPVHLVTGVQMKLVESLWVGVPAVTTPAIAAGAGVVPDVDCLVADGPDDWFKAVSRVLDDHALRESLSKHGREWALQNYSPPQIAAQLLAAVGEAIHSPGLSER